MKNESRSTRLTSALLLPLVLFASSSAKAQVQGRDRILPLDLAVEAAQEAVRSCSAHGWPVTATVVDAAGVARVQLKGDRSTIHTRDSSYRKAYTQATLGPIFGFDRLSVGVDKFRNNPDRTAIASLPDILLLAGAVAVKVDGETIAAIGVGGAPGGDRDESCAAQGLARIVDRLPGALEQR